MNQKKILVTGGAGLIGSNLILHLNELGLDNILVCDHLGTSEKWKNLSRLSFRDYIEKDKLLDKLNLFQEKKEIDTIFHLGACSSTTETNSSYLIHNNFEYTKALAEFSLANQIRFAYASSAATYGLGEFGYTDSGDITKLQPLNAYGYSKHLFDLYALRKGILNKILGLKYFNVFGYGEFHKGDMRSLVLKGFEQIKKTGKLQLFKSYHPQYKDGDQKRDFLYVKDAVKVTSYLTFEGKTGLYNVGRGVCETWNALASAMFHAMRLPVNIEYIEMPDTLKAKYQYYTQADTEKLIATGYKGGFYALSEAIEDYFRLMEA